MLINSNNEKETINIGYKVGKLLKKGDIVAFFGELGAGKTTMIKGIGKALGIDERDVISASFIIISEYKTKPKLVHIDLYRIDTLNDISEIGLWDAIGNENISVIEWAEKLKNDLPENAIKIHIKHKDKNKREILIEGINEEDWNNI